MIKRLYAAIPPDQLIVAPLVLDMTGLTLPEFRIRVQPPSVRNAISQGHMATQTFLSNMGLALIVTARTVLQPLQGLMRFGQRSRRQLGVTFAHGNQRQRAQDQNPPEPLR
jgi:hypothetical protein